MKAGIDAINLNEGGGKTHLLNILENYIPSKHPQIEKIVLWGKRSLLARVKDYPWLVKKTNRYINRGLLSRYFWIIFRSKKEFAQNCDILFSPGGLYFGSFRPYVTMSRNMLLFDEKARKKENLTLKIKLYLSSILHVLSLKRAEGIIFISRYAERVITQKLRLHNISSTLINHGISDRFVRPPEDKNYENNNTLKMLYVSHVYSYKNHEKVINAIKELWHRGFDIHLDLVGGGDARAIKSLKSAIRKVDSDGKFIIYHGNQPYEIINQFYQKADIFVYASTCENMPNILVEAMSSSLPIACSKAEPMPEFLKDGGLYFDPEDIGDIVATSENLINSSRLRSDLARKAFQLSRSYSWEVTAEKTFNFLLAKYNNFLQKKSSHVKE